MAMKARPFGSVTASPTSVPEEEATLSVAPGIGALSSPLFCSVTPM
jgi:hypothetical protein